MRSFLFLSFFGGAIAAAACSASGSSRNGFADDTDAASPADASPAETSSSSGSSSGLVGDAAHDAKNGSTCERDMTMGAISISNQACYVNEHVSNRSTKLEFPCAGGKATAVFSGKTFEGTIEDDTIALSHVEVFVFNACNWQSTETIDGDLSTGSLQYTYTEKPVTTCPDNPCTADGTVKVKAGEVVVVN